MVGDNDEKLVCQSFHLTGIDGNPLVSASIHIRYVERRREGINIATDIKRSSGSCFTCKWNWELYNLSWALPL